MKKLASVAMAIIIVLSMIGLVSAYDFDTRYINEGFSLEKFKRAHFILLKGTLTYKMSEEGKEQVDEIRSIAWRLGDNIISTAHTTWKESKYLNFMPPIGVQIMPITPLKIKMKARWHQGDWYDVKLKTVNVARDIAVFTLPFALRGVKELIPGKLRKVKSGDYVFTMGGCLRAYPGVWPEKTYTWKFGRVAGISVFQGHQEILVNTVSEGGDSSGVLIAFDKGKPVAIGLIQVTVGETGLTGVVPIDYYVEEIKKLEGPS